jgi:N-acetylglutamate synthase-like GNAT family acetyltransferase
VNHRSSIATISEIRAEPGIIRRITHWLVECGGVRRADLKRKVCASLKVRPADAEKFGIIGFTGEIAVIPRIRQARPEECGVLTEVAMRSKAHWGYDAEFMANVRADLEVIPEKFMPGFHVYVLENDAGIIGFYSLRLGDAEAVILEDLFIEPKHIGHGYGKQLWDHSLVVAQSLGYRKLTLISDPYAEGFYAYLGAIRIGETESNALAGRMLPLMEYTFKLPNPAS